MTEAYPTAWAYERACTALERHRSTLRAVAMWFALEIPANDMRWDGEPLPDAFMQMVSEAMVANTFIGWPDSETAYAFLQELGWAKR